MGPPVQLSGRPRPRDPDDLAAALRGAADAFGHRPALTVVRADRRDEQGFASLLRWAAKGAHLLELEALLAPGDVVRVTGPAGWPLATVCLAAWWAGVAVAVTGTGAGGDPPDDDAATGASATVLHERAEAAAPHGDALLYTVGDAPDGAPAGDLDGEPWAAAVQAFPDQPPPPRAGAGAVAVAAPGRRTHAELLDDARRWGAEATLGIRADAAATRWLPALVRPLVTGRATVVLDGADRDAAAGEGVGVWADDAG